MFFFLDLSGSMKKKIVCPGGILPLLVHNGFRHATDDTCLFLDLLQLALQGQELWVGGGGRKEGVFFATALVSDDDVSRFCW